MTSKDYLARGLYLDRRIKCKAEQLVELKCLATKVTSMLNDVKVQTAKNDHKQEDIIIKIVEYREELLQDMDRLMEIKKETKKAIDTVEGDEERMILEMRYLLYMRWEEIAAKLGYSIQHIFRMRNKALAQVKIKDESQCDKMLI